MNSLFQDLRHALRQFGRAPGFAAVAIGTLALGIGATTALFSVVHGVLLRPLPYPEPDRIVRVFEVGSGGTRSTNMSDPNFADLYERSRSFAGLAKFQSWDESVAGGSEPARVVLASVSRDFFQIMGVQPLLGRTFHADEHREGAAPAVLVSEAFWQRYLDGDPDLSGRTLKSGDEVAAVVGVMPRGFAFPDGADIWRPRELLGLTPSRTALNSRVVGRLADGVFLERARADVRGIARRLKTELGDDTWMADAAVVPLHEEMVGRTRPALLLLLGASGFLLLIACANVVSLLLARLTARRGELAVRIALGAGRGRLVRQLLTESLFLSLTGGALGVLVARWGVDLLLGLETGNLPRLAEIRVEGSALVFALAVSVLVAVGLGLVAAWRAIRDGVQGTLGGGQRTQTRAGSARLRGALIVSQVALTLVLLVGAGLLGRSLLRLLAVDPGFRTDGAVVMNLSLPWPEDDAEAIRLGSFHEEVLARLEAIPGVDEVGGVNLLPLASSGWNGTFLVVNHPAEVTDFEGFKNLSKDPERTGEAEFRIASEDYFRAMSIPLLRGRPFDRGDSADAEHVAVISQSLAATQWPDEDPIGKLIQFGNMDGDLTPFRVVGVVGDVRSTSLESEPRPTFYAFYRQRPSRTAGFSFVIQGAPDPSAVISQARSIVRELAPEVPPDFRTLEQLFADSLTEHRFQLLLLGIFGATALLLAVAGIYGVISFHVALRTQEIGVRMALGATGENVIRLVVRRGLLLAALGVTLGLAGALAVTRLMRGLLYGVTATDPITFLVVPLVLVTATVLACTLPAWRAARVDPMTALRSD